MYVLGFGLPDELKACLYNEGLTIRYSTKPYDNIAVEPWSHSHRQGRGLVAAIGIAASLVSFIAGYGLLLWQANKFEQVNHLVLEVRRCKKKAANLL